MLSNVSPLLNAFHLPGRDQSLQCAAGVRRLLRPFEGRDLGGVANDIERVLDQAKIRSCLAAAAIVMRGQVQSMKSNPSSASAWDLLFAVLLVYLSDGCQFPVLARPAHHHDGAARRAFSGIVSDALRHANHVERARA